MEWFPWGDEAFRAARDLDRPILLSVGYSACHWCHVMAHECFENVEIAALMNRLFISVKVDREERPDVDAVYMQAVQALTGQGGWPMTVFLTPGGVPYFGGTYFPPVDRGGLPGFPAVLNAACDAYRDRRDDVERAGREITLALAGPPAAARHEASPAAVTMAVARLVEQTDRHHGGFGGPPKFPHPGAIELLLRGSRHGNAAAPLEAAAISLDAMIHGGIFDQIGGGFHRYCVDGEWSVPHFEKMLYDNAQLALVYLHSYQVTGDGEHRVAVEATLDYLVREMLIPGGGFASSQDADQEGAEGRFFTWTPGEMADALGGGDDAEVACRVFGVSEQGNFEQGSTVLSLPRSLDETAEELGTQPSELLAKVRDIARRLLAARGRRSAPGRDDKVITAWNALAVRAFAEAGAALDRQDYVDVAQNCAGFLRRELVVAGRVRRSWRGGALGVGAFLEDVAGLGDALLALYQACGDPQLIDEALVLAAGIPRHFHVPGTGYVDTADDAELLLVRPRRLEDTPLPSGQTTAARLFLGLAGLTGDVRWHDRALEIIEPFVPAIARTPLALSGLAGTLDQAVSPSREIAVAGAPEDPLTRSLLAVVWRRYDPNRVLAWGPAGSVPLLAGRRAPGGRPIAYVCENFACRTPTGDPEVLRAQLEAAPSS